MGNAAWADLFFGISAWVDMEKADAMMNHDGDVIVDVFSVGMDDNDDCLLAVYWKTSRFGQNGEYVEKFDFPVLDMADVRARLVKKWEELGFGKAEPQWHLIASYG